MTSLADLQSRASTLFRTGQTAKAIVAYRELLAARPDLPNSWFNLALSLRRAGSPREALDAYGRALDYAIQGPEEVHLQRAVILSDDLDRSEDARSELATALAIDPDYVPALLNLGNLHEDCGERDAARLAYARAVQLDGQSALALARLVGLTLPGEDNAGLIQRARAFLKLPGLSPLDRADIGFALGGALDRAGDYREAFAVIADANLAMRRVALEHGQAYDLPAEARLVDRLIAAFPARADKRHTDDWSPIFIVGMFRSGSTLVEQFLSRHSAVDAGGELDLIPRFVRSDIPNYPEDLAQPDPVLIDTLRDKYLEAVADRRMASHALTDKRPDNFLHIGLIKQIFPNARIVVTSRDPVDTALSVYFLHSDPSLAYASDLGDIAHHMAQSRRLIAHWHSLYGEDIQIVDYDVLIKDPRGVLKSLLGFLGLPWEDAVLREDGAARAVRTASNWQVRQPLYQSSSGRWRNYADELGAVRKLLAEQGMEHT